MINHESVNSKGVNNTLSNDTSLDILELFNQQDHLDKLVKLHLAIDRSWIFFDFTSLFHFVIH